MNIQEMDILKILAHTPYTTQRNLSDLSGHSLGIVNRSLKALERDGLIDDSFALTKRAAALQEDSTPRRAVILAAGYGMRMVPINTEVPKAFLEVRGELLIERQIRFLLEAGITDITVVVGFMKEAFDYLVDTYGVTLIVNPEYSEKNNLHSLFLARKKLENAYILPSDLWCRDNPFSQTEFYSWYSVTEKPCPGSLFRINRNRELVQVSDHETGCRAIGISYLTKDDAGKVCSALESLDANPYYKDAFWEETLFHKDRLILPARILNDSDVIEINTYEQLREFDQNSGHLKSDAIKVIEEALGVSGEDIKNISVIKKGMTNRSFLFSCKGVRYIMRIPGEGTDQLINRREEACVYQLIKDKALCDDVIYISPETGYKITRYIENPRVCDPASESDVKKCMKRLKAFHAMKLKVDHTFDIFEKIDFYESLWQGQPSVYRDYKETKAHVLALKDFIDSLETEKVLTHMDAVADNFLIARDAFGNADIRLIDWEYASLQDPHVDIAMFAIYAMYDKEDVDRLIDIYFENACDPLTRAKIYAYIAACGLLWSNWCEYKYHLGIEFGAYSLKQYRFAKDYYTYTLDILSDREVHHV